MFDPEVDLILHISTGSGNLKRMIKSIAALSIIPVIGLIVSFAILNSLADGESVSEFVSFVEYSCSVEYQSACDTFENIILLRDGSFYSFIFSFLIVFSYFFVSKLAGTNRNLIAALFPPLIPLVLIMVSIQTIIQGAIITYGAYIGESFLLGVVHYFLIGAIGLGAGIGALQIVGAVFSIAKKVVHTQIGKRLLQNEQPKIWELVTGIADDIGAKAPDNIVVGIDPTFYATAADVVGCGDIRLKGETLYLSLPLMRLFSLGELKAVIGHELGHFKAKDTAYSSKFAPVYRGLGNSINSLADSSGGASDLGKIPALFILSSMYESFEQNVATISREREFEADKVGVSVSSPEDLAHSLSKVVLFASLWTTTKQENIQRLNEGKFSPNLSLVFKDSSAYNLSRQNVEDAKRSALESSVSHPTDSHPILKDRFANIGLQPEDLALEKILAQGDSCSNLIENLEEIEEELTLIEHQMMVALGYVVLPDESEENSGGLERFLYSMAAAMIGADGKIEQEEVAVAETIGSQLVSSFDNTDFRAFINNLDSIPDIIELANTLSSSLSDEGKELILTYLEAIAGADGDVSEEESRMLREIKGIWS